MKYKDKIQHAIVCCSLVIIGDYLYNLNLGIFLALIFSFSKELWDSTKPNNKWDWEDLVADLGGILLGIAITAKGIF